MPVTISNVSTSNTFNYWLTITNQLATAMSTYAITTNANVATGNAVVNGYIQANGFIANSLTVNGGSGTINVAALIANTLSINVATITTISANAYTGNNLTITTISGNSFSGNVASFANLTVTQNATINNQSVTNSSITTGTVTTLTSTTGTITNLTTNTIIANTSLKIGNTTSNVTILAPNTTQQGGTYYLNGNGSWVVVTGGSANVAGSNTQVQFNDSGALGASAGFIFNKTSNNLTIANAATANIYIAGNNQWQQIYTTTTGTSLQTIDSFAQANWGGARYDILMYQASTNAYLKSTMDVVVGANSAIGTEYGTVYTNGVIGAFSLTTNATHALLQVTPTTTTSVINLQRTLLSL